MNEIDFEDFSPQNLQKIYHLYYLKKYNLDLKTPEELEHARNCELEIINKQIYDHKIPK